jgi:putative tricarboxylic transport membrane protein
MHADLASTMLWACHLYPVEEELGMRTMKRINQITGLVWLLFSVFMARESLRMVYYDDLGPGAGFLPFWASVIQGVLATGILVRATIRPSDPMPADFFATRAGYLRVTAVLVAVALVVVLFYSLGFRLIMFTFSLSLLFVLGRPNPLIALLVALALSFGTYYAFTQWLRVPLPVGIFGI